MKHSYKIDIEQRVIYSSFKGKSSIEDLERALDNVVRDQDFCGNFNFLTDIRDCQFAFRPQEMTSFFSSFREKLSNSTGKSAILVDTPIETAIASIHKNKMSDTRKIKLFTTREAALAWLGLREES